MVLTIIKWDLFLCVLYQPQMIIFIELIFKGDNLSSITELNYLELSQYIRKLLSLDITGERRQMFVLIDD